LSSNTAVSQGNFNLDFISTGGDLNFDQNTLLIDASNNKVGVNEATPTSTLDIHGSISLPTAHFTATTGASYTMNEDDYLLFANTSSAVAYINLPAPTTCPGRVYRFIKTRTANGIMFNRTIEVTPSTVTNHFTGTDIKLTIISDGSLWWKLEN
jgi:hypothetical protein